MLIGRIMIRYLSQCVPMCWPWSVLISKWDQASILRRFLRILSSSCWESLILRLFELDPGAA